MSLFTELKRRKVLGRDERGSCPLRGRAASFGGVPFFFWLVMGTRRTTDVLPRLVRHRHVELDRRELLGGQARTLQERQPTRIRTQSLQRRVVSYRASVSRNAWQRAGVCRRAKPASAARGVSKGRRVTNASARSARLSLSARPGSGHSPVRFPTTFAACLRRPSQADLFRHPSLTEDVPVSSQAPPRSKASADPSQAPECCIQEPCSNRPGKFLSAPQR